MDKAKKKQMKKAVTWVLLATLVAGLAAMPLLAKEKAESDGPVASVLSGTVEESSITSVLHGGGTLASEDVEDITLPAGVKITEFLVRNGDTVTEGTPLAAVDPVSVMTAIMEVTDTMEYLQQEIRNSREEKISSTVSATAGGRIKQVFARQGDSVQEVMLRDGALAVLSLDGLVAVKIQRDLELPTGSSVILTFDDGTETEGRVESNLDGTIVVTAEDTGYDIGQTVIVTTDEGKRVGSGELYVHNAWAATAFSGTIQTVWAKEETKVTSGSSLFTLTDTDFKAQLEYMSSLHREYEELLQDLFRMYNSGTIDAPCDGMVSGVDEDSAHLLASESGEEYEIVLLNGPATEEKGWKIVLLSTDTYDENTCGSETCPLKGNHTVNDCPRNICTKADADCPANAGKHDLACLKACTKAASPNSCQADKHYSECIESCDHADTDNDCNATSHHFTDCIKNCTKKDTVGLCTSEKHYTNCIEYCNPRSQDYCGATGKHKTECIKSCTRAGSVEQCDAHPNHYPDCIKACIISDSSNKVCPASKHDENCFFANMIFTAKVALVEQIGSTSLVVRWDVSGKSYPVEKSGSSWKFSGNTSFSTELLVNEGKLSVDNPNAYKAGDVILDITGYKGNEPSWHGVGVYTNIPTTNGSQNTIPGMGAMGDLSSMMGSLSGMMGGMSGLGGLSGFGNAGFSAASPVEEDKLFDLTGSTLLTVSPGSTVSLTITLDEQDISKVSVGQKASVKVQALSGQVFEAEVVEVSNHGVNSGGSSKFTAKLRLDKTADMIDGMSATASLQLQTRENIPVIPVAALVQQGARTVVFTALDKETGEPANPVPVTVGISDGTNAEILEGLKPGDTYYYSYYDVLEEDTGVEDRFTLT